LHRLSLNQKKINNKEAVAKQPKIKDEVETSPKGVTYLIFFVEYRCCLQAIPQSA
jgi:hypothetical protein